jgi:hypothetical protein
VRSAGWRPEARLQRNLQSIFREPSCLRRPAQALMAALAVIPAADHRHFARRITMTTAKPILQPLLVAGLVLSAATAPSLAAAPQAVTITTQATFNAEGLGSGTFVAAGPVYVTGTFYALGAVFSAPNAWLIVNGLHHFDCDDNSGSFEIRLHPQGNPRPGLGFDLNGPWSIWGKGTGAYRQLAGHGDFGVVITPGSDPLSGVETFVGFVTL